MILNVPTELATKVLVFMIVAMSGHSKNRTVYVLQDTCTASVQSQITKD